MTRLEEIHNRCTVIGVNDEAEYFILKTISRLPIVVQAEILDNHVIFIPLSNDIHGHYEHLSEIPTWNLHFITLNLDSIDSGEERMFLIAREIAHFILRHVGVSDEDEYNRNQEDANLLAEEWGFAIPERLKDGY